MATKPRKKIRMRWEYVLAAVAVVGVLFGALVFYPGYMSNDSIAYMLQALGDAPLDSLHPIFMSLFWGALIKATGYISSMLLAQLFLLWASSLLLALYIYKKTQSRRWSVAAVLIPLFPYVFNISGVLWSDILYAGLMFLAVACSLWIGEIRQKHGRLLLLLTTISILMMAMMVRYNTAPAVIPIIALALYRSDLVVRRVGIAGATTAIAIIALGSLFLVSNTLSVKDEKLINGPMLDDIVNVAPRELITSSTAGDARVYILGVYDCSEKRNIKVNAIHVCKPEKGGSFESAAPHTDSIRLVWQEGLARDPLQYFLYKVAGFAAFLFPAEGAKYIWHEGIDANHLGIEPKSPHLGKAVSTIIHNLFYKYLTFLYEPWFWLAVAMILGYKALRSKRTEQKYIVLTLSISSMLVILSYMPTGATVDYRYIYWPAIAMTIAVLLVVMQSRPGKLLAKIK